MKAFIGKTSMFDSSDIVPLFLNSLKKWQQKRLVFTDVRRRQIFVHVMAR